MKTNKILKALVLIVLSAVMSLCAVACSSAKKYTVTLDANGGVIDGGQTSIEVTLNKDYTLPTPTKAGYTFEGWMQGTELVATTGKWTTKSNVSVKASWAVRTYTVTLDANGGEGLTTTTYSIKMNEYLDLSGVKPTKAGYNFVGWALNGTLITEDVITWSYDNDATLVAQWIGATTQVTISAAGGQGVENAVVTVSKNEVLNLPTVTKAGYTFAGWKLNDSEDFVSGTAWTLDADTATITAQWTANTYTVTVDVNGGDALDNNTVTVTFGQVITLPTVTKAHSQVDKWFYGTTEVDVTKPWNIADNVTLVVQWTGAHTAITFDVNGGEALPEESATATFVYGETVTLPVATKVGYINTGWTYNGTLIEGAWEVDAATATLVAQWTAKEIPVVFETAGGVEVANATFTFGEAPYANAADVPTTTKANYNFNYWMYNNNRIDLTQVWSQDVEEIKLVARWTAKTTAVTFNVNGGEELPEESATTKFTYGAKVTLPAATKYGYVLEGWTYGENTYTADSVWEFGEEAEAILVAKWAAKVMPVVFNTTGGGEIAGTTFTFGEVPYANAADVPTAEKGVLQFVGWTYNGQDVDLTTVWQFDADEIELVAKYAGAAVSTVTVKYNFDGAQDAEIQVTVGDVFDFSYNRFGYKLVGYIIEDTETEIPVSGNVWEYRDNITIVAQWIKREYKVTIKDNEGNELTEEPLVICAGDVQNWIKYVPFDGEIEVDGKVIKLEKSIIVNGKQMFFDGFKLEGGEYKITNSFENIVWTYESEVSELVFVLSYESEDMWI